MPLKYMKLFEEKNPGKSIYVYSLNEEKKAILVRVVGEEKNDDCDLLIIANKENSNYIYTDAKRTKNYCSLYTTEELKCQFQRRIIKTRLNFLFLFMLLLKPCFYLFILVSLNLPHHILKPIKNISHTATAFM
ncbi:hypothetical protein PR048_020310 [Dryococelus australis]|uniref:Uncharacterized protein n=1 Tax=Dryococelus australis TaxID=614101 RepID=A0ABQ9H621_9NEOP|nr:hypothetical protein PR048_020310 [Dryococelus australis]